MMKKNKMLLLIACLLWMGICPQGAFSEVKPPVRVVEKVDPVVVAGKKLMETRCSACHVAPRPDSHTQAEWPSILNEMAPRAFLRPSDMKTIQAYLETSLQKRPAVQ